MTRTGEFPGTTAVVTGGAVLERNPDWGHIVNTSSMSVLVTPPDVAPYVASKAAVLGISEVLAAELAEAGSRVVEAVRAGEPYVVTHGEFWDAAAARSARVLDAFPPAPVAAGGGGPRLGR